MEPQNIGHEIREAHRKVARNIALASLSPNGLRHSYRVAQLVGLYGGHYDTVTAAYLHDVVEDTSTTLRDLRDAGIPANICRMVLDLTNKFTDLVLPRFERKRREADRLMQASRPVRLVKLCDRLDNLLRIERKPGVGRAFMRLYADESVYLISQIAHDLPERLIRRAKDAAADLNEASYG